MEFICKSCDYLTTNQSNYRKHLRTDKHKRKEKIQSVTQPILSHKSESTIEIQKSTKKLAEVSPKLAEVSPKLAEVSPKVLECKYCLQQFKHKSSLSKHIKYTCMKNKDEDLKELVRLLNLQLETEREERKKVQKQVEQQQYVFQKKLNAQEKQIEKLMGKLEINGSFNNNTIHVSLLSYRNTDVSHLTNEDYRNCYKKVNHCVKHLIEKVHFNPAKPENMNIYISNMKDKYLMVYDGVNWNLANKVDELDRLYEEKEMMLEDWLESNPDPILKEKFVKYLNNKEKDECLNQIKEEIKLLLYNQGNALVKPLLEGPKTQTEL